MQESLILTMVENLTMGVSKEHVKGDQGNLQVIVVSGKVSSQQYYGEMNILSTLYHDAV